MRRLHRELLLGLALALTAAAAQARESDRQQPMSVEADDIEATMDENSESKLIGNVRITQGTLLITAAQATISRNEGEIRRVVLDGQPASMQQDNDEGVTMKANANRIDYDVTGETVVLTGNVRRRPGRRHAARRTHHLRFEERPPQRQRRRQRRARPHPHDHPAPPEDRRSAQARGQPSLDAGRAFAAQEIPRARSRPGFQPRTAPGRSRRPARPERRRQDHLLLHDRGPGTRRRRRPSCSTAPTSPPCRCTRARAAAWVICRRNHRCSAA